MSPEHLVVASVLLPLISAVLVVACRQRPNLRETVTLVSGGLLLATVSLLVGSVDTRPAINLIDVIPGSIDRSAIAIGFHVEPLGLLFALLASGLWIATSVYSIGYMRSHGEQHQTRFYVCFAIAISAVMGIAFARNLLTLFLFYEVLTLSTYPLVTHHGTEAARRAGRTYLGILMGTSIVGLLMAILWTWQLAGTLEFKAGGILDGHVDLARDPADLGRHRGRAVAVAVGADHQFGAIEVKTARQRAADTAGRPGHDDTAIFQVHGLLLRLDRRVYQPPLRRRQGPAAGAAASPRIRIAFSAHLWHFPAVSAPPLASSSLGRPARHGIGASGSWQKVFHSCQQYLCSRSRAASSRLSTAS